MNDSLVILETSHSDRFTNPFYPFLLSIRMNDSFVILETSHSDRFTNPFYLFFYRFEWTIL